MSKESFEFGNKKASRPLTIDREVGDRQIMLATQFDAALGSRSVRSRGLGRRAGYPEGR